MNSFKEYFELNKKYKIMFDDLFNEYYDSGYFGKIKKKDIKKAQMKWFCKVIHIVEHKRASTLLPMNRLTKDMVSILSGIELSNKPNKMIEEIIRGFDV